MDEYESEEEKEEEKEKEVDQVHPFTAEIRKRYDVYLKVRDPNDRLVTLDEFTKEVQEGKSKHAQRPNKSAGRFVAHRRQLILKLRGWTKHTHSSLT
jgi:hypothetical protein